MRHRINVPIVRSCGSFSVAEIFGATLNFHLLVLENKKKRR